MACREVIHYNKLMTYYSSQTGISIRNAGEATTSAGSAQQVGVYKMDNGVIVKSLIGTVGNSHSDADDNNGSISRETEAAFYKKIFTEKE